MSWNNHTKRPFREAAKLYLHDAKKLHLIRVMRVFLLILAGYAPFAALNDALIPFTFGLTALDDPEIPFGILAAMKIYFDIRKYQSYQSYPDY